MFVELFSTFSLPCSSVLSILPRAAFDGFFKTAFRLELLLFSCSSEFSLSGVHFDRRFLRCSFACESKHLYLLTNHERHPIQAEIPILRLMLPRRRDGFLGCHRLCIKRESVSWDVSYIGFLCWYLRFALMFTHVDALLIMIHSSCLFILLLFGAWMPGTTAALTEQMAREIGLAICRHNSCGNWFLWMWKRMRWPRIFFATSGFHEAWSWSAIGSRKMRGCQIAEART